MSRTQHSVVDGAERDRQAVEQFAAEGRTDSCSDESATSEVSTVTAARRRALDGGARYRGTGTTTGQRPSRGGTAGTRCLNCGRSVTKQFARVFGDNDDRAFGCFACHSVSAIKRGAARSADVELAPSSDPVR